MRKPARMCVACRTSRDKSELIRLMAAPDGDIVPDAGARGGGRGVYICRCEECIAAAAKRHSLDRAFKKKVPDDIYDRLRECL